MDQDPELPKDRGQRPAPFTLEEVPNYEPDQRMRELIKDIEQGPDPDGPRPTGH